MHEIRIPRLGWSMEEGTLVRWLKQDGDTVRKGETLFELEGDKNLQDIEATDSGTLHIPSGSPSPGSLVAVGTLVGWVLGPGESPPTAASTGHELHSQEPRTISAGPAARRIAAEHGIELSTIPGTGRSGLITKEDATAAVESMTGPMARQVVSTGITRRVVATPRARRKAREQRTDLRMLKGTGRNGRIREADVLAAGASSARGTSDIVAKRGQSLPPRRRAIAERLRRSQALTVPVTLHLMADVTETVALRNRLKAANAKAAPAYTDLVAALLPRVFAAHPQMARTWDEAHESLVSVSYEEIRIGIAVDTPEGLVVPVIRQAGNKTLTSIVEESRRLIALARAGQLSGNDMKGGTFTITNLGAFGIEGFTPVINLPEIAILGLGAIREEPVFLEDRSVAARHRMTLSLTFDHAAVDGAPAAAFLSDLAKALADPAAFLLG